VKTQAPEKIYLKIKNPDIIEYDSRSVVMINPEEPTWIKTSATGRWIYEFIKEKGSIEINELVSEVVLRYSLPIPVIKRIVTDLVNKLADYNFVQIGVQPQLTNIVQHNEDRSNDELPRYGLISLWFSITSECNLSCQHCFVNKSQPGRSIPLERALHVFHEAAKLNVKRLCLSGGEPLLHPQIVDIVTSAKKVAAWDIIFITNGFTDDVDLIEKISKQIGCFQFSIDGIDECTHDSIRGAGSFRKVMNIVMFLNKIHSNVRITLSFTPHPNNIQQIPDLYKLALKLNADSIHITKPKKPAIQSPHLFSWNKEFLSIEFRRRVFAEYDKLIKGYLKQKKGLSSFKGTKIPVVEASFDPSFNLLLPGKRACCGAGGNQLFINELGDCYPCVALVRPEHLLGNVFLEPLEQIYQDKGVLKFRQSIHIDHIVECSDCSFRYFCAGDCRAMAESSKQRSPYCELIKERYDLFLKNISVQY
jgi:radical SAM protein with 4Fe4S-binding SPASM domain